MLSPAAIHRYVVLILAVALAITLVVLLDHAPNAPATELLCAGGIGWCVGQIFPWQPR